MESLVDFTCSAKDPDSLQPVLSLEEEKRNKINFARVASQGRKPGIVLEASLRVKLLFHPQGCSHRLPGSWEHSHSVGGFDKKLVMK